MKTRYLILLLLTASLSFSCGKDDDNHSTPLNSIDNYFVVPDDAMDNESVLRREFFNTTGVHLLFNDTLQVISRGTDRFGSEIRFVKMLDPGYSFTAHTGLYYRFRYIPDSDMAAVVAFLQNDVLSKLAKSLYPYSVMVAENIDSYEDNGYDTSYKLLETDVQFYNGYRCMLISVRGINSMTPQQRADRAQEILISIAASGVAKLDESMFTDFFEWGKDYYKQFGNTATVDYYALGFLGYNPFFGTYVYWYSKAEDIASYVEAALSMSEAEFLDSYGKYEACVAKYYFIRTILEGFGFTF